MYYDDFNSKYLKFGQFTCRAVFILGLTYAVTTVLGFFSLKSPQEPIGNPYFTIMEILTILIVPLMAISMVAVHYHASPVDKIYSLAALLFMFITAGITSSVHFIIITVSYQGQVGHTKLFLFLFVQVAFCSICIRYSRMGLVFCSFIPARVTCIQDRQSRKTCTNSYDYKWFAKSCRTSRRST
jgi:DMSO reductase anchor subunit